ncbi:unnamed protein product [Ilex paraguariensis]|uniref:Aspartic proteinase Asp1 n=1 Tax=Ilex paraguariensis TaxID=185542 RepID=A0ABC8TPB1_9AQUA
MDTGSDLTWLQCDAPCTKCTPTPHTLYKPNKNVVTCKDPLCGSLNWSGSHPCETPDEQCDYEVQYADHGSSLGVLVKDSFPLRFINGSTVGPRLTFGCGYNQEFPDTIRPPFTDGVLGLGSGKSSIVSQLQNLGLTQNVVGHCLSVQGGGFLFFGDDLVPSSGSGIIWTPMLHNPPEEQHSLGPAELLFDGRTTGVKGLKIVFDTGSTYSYFNLQAYKALVSLIMKDLNGKQLKETAEDRSLPLCWKGRKPFKSIRDVKNYFRPIELFFMNDKNVQFQLQPKAYLIVTEHGNVCLGILNGTEVGLGNVNIIGDISMQDKMVIYDNENQWIGWVTANCDRLPNLDQTCDEGFSQPYADNLGILGHSTANFGSVRSK